MRLSDQDERAMREQIRRALDEDLSAPGAGENEYAGDLTTSCFDYPPIKAELICRENGVLAGAPWFDETLRAARRHPACAGNRNGRSSGGLSVDWYFRDGDAVKARDMLCTVSGDDAGIVLCAERVALNFVQTLSGVATAAAKYAALAGRSVIRDTRKTLPGLRRAQKYAVRCGGGTNHRFGLYDAVLIKDNHIAAYGSVAEAVARVKHERPGTPIEVEVNTQQRAHEALAAGVECILLDNFDLGALRETVAGIGGRVKTEASGNITLDNVADVAATGVDYIAVGALTKHVHAIDMSLRLIRA